tara:strand:+ start:302 stop:508 length:207 start_codon:yes stop_codon:yes gene_type:complete
MNELLKGLRVKISTASRFYQEVQNPICEGAIECETHMPEGWFGVDWDDGDWNSYQIDDLVFIDELESK